jgi:RNA-binding protein Tab2/Atab2
MARRTTSRGISKNARVSKQASKATHATVLHTYIHIPVEYEAHTNVPLHPHTLTQFNGNSYKATMVGSSGPSFLDVRTPVKLPDSLRGEQYAFVGLPLAEFFPGGDISQDNVGVGKLCPLDPNLPADAFVQGVVILTQRATALASWLAGTEVVALTCDLRKRQLIMETDIDTQYLVARLDDVQRLEGAAFEQGKDALNGLHFISVQQDDESDPAGFWLLREIPAGI